MDSTLGNSQIRKVLFLTTDIYSRIGGGEQVYRTLIQDNPRIDFYFFSSNHLKTGELPRNAHAVPLKVKPKLDTSKALQRYNSKKSFKVRDFFNPNEINSAELAEQYSSSVAHQDFDLIDIPEYELVGSYLRESLRRHQVNYRLLSVFLHGALSKTLEYEIDFSRDAIHEIKQIEKVQRKDADFYFTLDYWYPKQLGINPNECIQLDPWLFVGMDGNNDESSDNHDSKSLVFFARWERRKGLDLLPTLVRLIGDNNIKLKLAGAKRNSERYSDIVESSAVSRNISYQNLSLTDSNLFLNSLGKSEILVVPSRFDSFNLVALEGIAKGKKVAISKECGVYHHLNTFYPSINFIQISSKDMANSAKVLSIHLNRSNPPDDQTIQNLQVVSNIFKQLARDQFTTLLNTRLEQPLGFKTYSTHGLIFKKSKVKRRLMHYLKVSGIQNYVTRYAILTKQKFKTFFQDFLNSKFLCHLFLLIQINPLSQRILRAVDRNGNIILNRPMHFLELSNEGERYSHLRKITYGVRSLRFSGYKEQTIQSGNLVADLRSVDLMEEAKALECLVSEENSVMVFDYLESRRLKLLNIPVFKFSESRVLHSNSFKENPKVSIIVSALNTTSKLPLFLNRLALCPELKDGSAEILLIDAHSNSPDAEISINLANKLDISLRAIRVNKKITIQEAWNYGITRSLGKYLCFLGVDESIFPSAITELSDVLNSNDEIDWVMSNSIVSEVNLEGDFIRDLMAYNRKGADVSSPFLETCFVSYVGGMYRKSIHEKFGFYDSSFKGAGDTEFKSRVLPSLKVHYLDRTLGEFFNYPEERTTASERIELEDIRAWYIFRSPGGLKYQASLAGEGFLETLGWSSLGYRKSYCKHTSTDLEIASAIYSITKNGDYGLSNDLLKELKIADQQLQTLRQLIGFGSLKWRSLRMRRFYMLAKWFDLDDRKSAANGVRRMRLDNMFEQHIWYW